MGEGDRGDGEGGGEEGEDGGGEGTLESDWQPFAI